MEKEKTMSKNVLITRDMFLKIVWYILLEKTEHKDEISDYLEEKLNRLIMHEAFSAYKADPSSEKGQEAIRKYLDKKGVPEQFRY